MEVHSRSGSIVWGPLLVALAGLAWCGYIAFPSGMRQPCASAGCSLFQDAKLWGLSLWWLGGAYFFLLALLCLRGKRMFAWRLARLALVLDSLLLLFMFGSAPCADCLVVAVFFGVGVLTLRPSSSALFTVETRRCFLLPIWLGLLLGNGIVLFSEQTPLWGVTQGNGDRSVQLFFSPSCPACRDAIAAFGSTAVMHPVMEREEDLRSILIFSDLLEKGVTPQDALRRSLDPKEQLPPLDFGAQTAVSFRLMRNKAAVLRQGFSKLPLIQVNGMPRSWKVGQEIHSGGEGGVSSPPQYDPSPWQHEEFGQCPQGQSAVCEE